MIKKLLHGIWCIVEAIIIAYVIFIASCILFRNDYGYTQFDKYTMVSIGEEDTRYLKDFKDGDLLLVKSTIDINEGDLIYYYATVNEKYVIRSGVVASKTEDDESVMYVLNDEDKTTLSDKKLLGKYSRTYPKWGKVLSILESRFGFLFLVLLPIMIIFIYQVYEFVLVVKYEKIEKIKEEPKTPKKEEKVEEKKLDDKQIEVKKEETEEEVEFL